MIVGQQPGDFRQAAGHHLAHGFTGYGGDVLWQVGAARTRTQPHRAGIGQGVPVNEAHQRRLALAVAADDADALAGFNLQAGLL